MYFPSFITILAVASVVESSPPPLRRSTATLPVINTTQGQLQGAISNYRSGATVYKGIPFAAPPTGDLRWRAPQSPAAWDGIFNATEFGPQCAQQTSSAGVFVTGESTTSEDCLTLNVWTPTYNDTSDLASKQLPVYVWLFGGRFSIGSGDVKTYDGSGLAVKDIIVVTLNYRLGAFGFLAHPELSAESGHNSSGNYGLLDQQFALRWVQDNIANFGGNPNQVVVGGQSAGSASSLAVMYSSLTTGLINGVIAESGARAPHDPLTGSLATSHRDKTTAEASGVDFLQDSLNVSSIAEARNISTETLVEYGSLGDTIFDGTVYANLSAAFMNPPLWRPVIDGYVLSYTYGESLRRGAHLDVPILTGSNRDESGASLPVTNYTVAEYTEAFSSIFQNFSTQFLELYPPINDTAAGLESNNFFRDLSRVSGWTWANEWVAGGAQSDVYTYCWAHTPPDDSDRGAYHGSELWYVFNNIPYASVDNVTWSSEDYSIEAVMSEYWVNFIRTGNPNGDGQVTSQNLTYFPPSTTAGKQTMWLGDSWGAGNLTNTEEKREFLVDWMNTLYEW
ncbi:Carboxylesterase [Pseudomassariella vexata]|uniref:Carboxylic ester hydrolase n=1 Tax=Pseudomassariella vexata TaxID=1141098 RepID=A0A1Y2E263_9PEZI|nr:Carboxylesterase [Pseudomassariella vexata]ORY65537.1 Carboxylesterase [Pseudomassariella vexata]